MRTENDAIFGHFCKRFFGRSRFFGGSFIWENIVNLPNAVFHSQTKTERLESSTISDHRLIPRHEFVQASLCRNDIFAWPKHKVVRVSERDLCTKTSKYSRIDRFHCGPCSDHNKGWCLDNTVFEL